MRLFRRKKKEVFADTVYINAARGEGANRALASAALRLGLVYLFAAGLLGCICTALEIPVSLPMMLGILLLSVTVFFAVLMLRRWSGPVMGLLLLASGAFVYFTGFYVQIAQAFLYTYNYCLYMLDHGLLATGAYMTLDRQLFAPALLQGAYQGLLTLAIGVIAVALALLFSLCLSVRTSLAPCILIMLSLISPCILASRMPALASFALMISALIGLYSTRVAANAQFAGRKRPLLEESGRARRSPVYGRHGVSAAICAGICAVAFTVSSLAVPAGTYFSFDGVVDKASDIGESLSGAFDGGLDFGYGSNSVFGGGLPFTGGLSYTNLLSVGSPSLSDREVLRVSSDAAVQVFLRGTVGVDFTGAGWTDISDEQDQAYRQLLELGFQTEESAYRYYSLLDFYAGSGAEEPLAGTGLYFSNIGIEYLQSSKMVFFPVSAYGVDMRGNALFDTCGDTTAKFKSRMKDTNIRILALVPGSTLGRFSSAYSDTVTEYVNIQTQLYASRAPLDTWLQLQRDSTLSQALSDEDYCVFEGEYAKLVRQYYLNVPDEMRDELTELAEEVSMGELSRYGKVKALYDYLKDGYTYSLEPQQAESGLDDVRNFLFVSKRGHCALYASAMVLLARSLDIPARFAAGFAADTGENTEENGEHYTVLREKNFHAWAEVYFPGIGWMPFDATGIAGADSFSEANWEQLASQATTQTTTSATTMPPQQSTASSSDAAGVSTTAPAGGGGDKGLPGGVIVVLAVIGAMLALIAMVRLVAGVANARQRRLHTRFRTLAPELATEEMYRYILKLLSLSKRPPDMGEQPLAYARRIDKCMYMSGADVNFNELMPVFERREFGRGEAVTEAQRKSAYKYLRLLYDDLVCRNHFMKRIYLKLAL